MNQVTSVGGYILAFLAALLSAVPWLLRNDPVLRDEPREPSDPTPAAQASSATRR